MAWPAVGSSMPRPAESCGSRLMAANSVVPMVKPPMARASKARPAPGREGEAIVTWMGGSGRVAA